jgi:mutual gliding-motility protein MglA
MVFFNYATMQMAAKIVYYGPGLCGKTTNLHHIYTKTSPGSRGEMVSLETETDRTLFFDLLPIDVGVIGGFKTRLQLYTVPGQVFYNTTRKLVLKGVDGIVFVADSQMAMLDANIESLGNLRENLHEIGVELDELPLVLQLNKRDLPNIAPVEVMLNAIDPERRLDHVEAVAPTGVGVFETLKLISKLTLRTLRRRMTGDEPVRTPPPAGRAQFKVRDDNSQLTRTLGGSVAVPVIDEDEAAEVVGEAVDQASQPQLDADATIAAADIDRHILSSAPVAEPVPEPLSEPTPEPEAVESSSRPVVEDEEQTAQAPEAAPDVQPTPEPLVDSSTRRLDDSVDDLPAPEVEFIQTEKAREEEPEVKTVKVRSSVDVMAELEALRKRATQTTVKTPRRDVLADLESLRPKRDLHRTLHLQLPQDVLPRTRSVRVTLSFEDKDAGVIETRNQQLELGDTSDVQSLSVNLKVDLQ